jgi:hypothetical protein
VTARVRDGEPVGSEVPLGASVLARRGGLPPDAGAAFPTVAV